MKMKEEFSRGASKQTTPPSLPLHPDLHVALQLSKTVNPYTVSPSSVSFSHKHATFPGGSEGDASTCSGGDPGLSLGLEDPLEKGWQGTPVFLTENPMDRGAWRATVHGVAKSQTQLSD